MGDTKTKTKAAMLNELESIKGLLLEEDDIPILQEVIEQKFSSSATTREEKNSAKAAAEIKSIFEEQQDFFDSPTSNQASTDNLHPAELADELLNTLIDLEKQTEEITAAKFASETQKPTITRPSLAKATGENPFLPEHIRARLHGNNPPPLFAHETAKRISDTNAPSRQLGNTFTMATSARSNANQQDIIDSIIEKMMPDIEQELRARLEIMSKNILEDLNK